MIFLNYSTNIAKHFPGLQLEVNGYCLFPFGNVKNSFLKQKACLVRWLTPIISATQEVEIGRSAQAKS
jgi:hypothetical protein